MYSVETVVREDKDGNSFNQKMVFGTGRLTNDPSEIRTIGSGAKVLSGQKGHNFAIAFNNGKDKKATFFRVEAWDKTAELMKQLCFKGQEIEIAGRLKVETYKVNGEERTAETVVIDRFQVKQYKPKDDVTSSTEQTPQATGEELAGGEPVDVSDDDLPF